jgi:hypothetical protein
MKSDLIDLEVFIHHETDLAVLVSLDADSEKIWLPKSRIEINGRRGGRIADITLPERLAIEKGIV